MKNCSYWRDATVNPSICRRTILRALQHYPTALWAKDSRYGLTILNTIRTDDVRNGRCLLVNGDIILCRKVTIVPLWFLPPLAPVSIVDDFCLSRHLWFGIVVRDWNMISNSFLLAELILEIICNVDNIAGVALNGKTNGKSSRSCLLLIIGICS